MSMSEARRAEWRKRAERAQKNVDSCRETINDCRLVISDPDTTLEKRTQFRELVLTLHVAIDRAQRYAQDCLDQASKE